MDRSPSAGHIPAYNEDDPAGKYFEFFAAQNSNVGNEEFRFLGTAVYYKIYSSSSTMLSNNNSIEAVNDSTNYSAAAERMINYGYQELNTAGGSRSPLVPSGQEGSHVRIRLTNYYESNASEDWWSNVARIEIRPSQSEAPTATYVPRRSLGQNYSFDFGRYNKPEYSNNGINYDAPASGDEDFSGSSPSDGKYYVAMYAVAVGRDTTFTTYYSNVEYLGSVTIDANSENN